MLTRAILLIAAAASLASCVTRGGNIPYDPANFGVPDRAMSEEATYEVPLGPLDIVRVSVFQVPELTGEYQIDVHGKLDMPLVGSVSARDQSPEQFASSLERAYGQRYLNNPDITVRLITTSNRNITVEGGVISPGIFALTSRTTLLGAIAMARGVHPTDGNYKRVVVFRKIGGKTAAAAFDLSSIRHGEMADPVIYPGDTVVVDSASLKNTYRDLLNSIPLLAIFNVI
jgi:polysaccharide export outer membrane protein